LGNRRDFAAAVRNCDIYLDTYPISGGLAVQYAIQMRKPVIWIRHTDILGWSAHEYLLGRGESEFGPSGIEGFLMRLDAVIEKIRSRRAVEPVPAGLVPSPALFAERLGAVLRREDDEIHRIDVDLTRINSMRVREHYLTLENLYLKELPYLKFKYLRWKYFALAPVRATRDAFSILVTRRQRVVRKITAWMGSFRD
jgi:hypothetical protein